MIIPTAEPFFFPGGPAGCLLIHGFTGTPKEMRWMGEYLASAGHTVLGVRLAGHATRPKDMLHMQWKDWLASVEDGWIILNDALAHQAEIPPRIYLMGLSMGGALSLLFASQEFSKHYPVAGVVAMSTPYALPLDWRLAYIKLFRWFQPSVPKGPPDWHDEEASKDHIAYPEYPTIAIAQMDLLLAQMREVLPKISVPVLLMHSRQDTGVDPHNMSSIYNHLGSQDKEMLWVENSGHVITREPERQRVFQAASDFIQRINQSSS